ncbi:hypothetical protein [Cupriavidus metallidurans]|uniref:hypothetical protein n=1 Tax=Cupriavidus metallidurans TaxID=119219 RepID=UPI001CCF7214|nr:hypothetical protein [Cupriavidus metallidurans]UBM07918.1 hypothetical protein LAI70_09400 [Cupriavidus metallidurans]
MKTIHTALIAAALTMASAVAAVAATPDCQIHRPRDLRIYRSRAALSKYVCGEVKNPSG